MKWFFNRRFSYMDLIGVCTTLSVFRDHGLWAIPAAIVWLIASVIGENVMGAA